MTLTLIKPFYIYLLFTILWFLFMTWLSHQDGEHTSKTSLELANHMKHWFPVKDIGKLNKQLRSSAHVILFAVLTILLTGTLRSAKVSAAGMAVGLILTALWAWADEATKPLIQGRHFSWFDVRLNWMGIGIGILAGVLIYK